ncbi:hypothetical protein [Sulfuracidifex tepidarius]|uniref:SNARE associated Golgi protein n=1 Tax=Sulfuracidifex tepidarius TaxID=1294262 RepID=A0A510E031_9CREN|nr:hypothetical protein [Sulfuracidifex tepidarius]BBG22771.1 hypothetical protein IC006_0055 [Sulfuracidifex tepidarius]BBG25550.1 hypothetical protein IC007_0055 [Sulfuracidifex tepidarius]
MLSLALFVFLFAISFLFNATPFFGGPYTLIAATALLQNGVNPLSFLLVCIFTGLGAALSKPVMYLIGLSVKKPLQKNRNVMLVKRIGVNRGFSATLFIASVMPFLPMDDFLYLAGGAAKLNVLSMLQISIVAKIIKSSIEISTEILGLKGISEVTNINPVEIGIISIVVFSVLGYIIFKIDWEKTYQEAMKYVRRLTQK